MVLDLAKSEQPHWGHVGYQFGVNGGSGIYEDTDVCNGRKCYIWHTDDQYIIVVSS